VLRLDLGLEGLTSVRGIERCPALRTLLLNANRLRHLEPLQACPHLTTLSLRDNQVHTVRGLDQLTALVDLNLDLNPLGSLEGLPPSLRRLSAASNGLASLAGLKNLTALRRLELPANSLTCLAALQSCQELEHLDVAGNRVASLEARSFQGSGGQLELPALLYLCASDNQLAALPDGGLRAPLLRTLWLNRNQLTKVPPLWRMPHLESLHLQDNAIAHLAPLRYGSGYTDDCSAWFRFRFAFSPRRL
jgi:protein phosphatase 1 regulatory subunit 7